MSYHSLASTSQENNHINFSEATTNFAEICTKQFDLSLDSNKLEKFPKFNLDNDQSRQMDMCYDYDKCFTNTYEYSGNNFVYNGENSYNMTTTESNQSFNNTEQFPYNFNPEPQQFGKCLFF